MQQPYMFELRYGKWIKHDQSLHCGVEWCGVKIIYIFETTIYDFHRKILEILISLIFFNKSVLGTKTVDLSAPNFREDVPVPLD